MKKLIVPALLLSSCFLHPVAAQKAPLAKKKMATLSKAQVRLPQTVVAEFCINYKRYYFDLPAQYREYAYQYLQEAGLTLGYNTPLTTRLSQSNTLREAAYQSLYMYCADIKPFYKQSVDEIMFVTLYETLHMNTGGATVLVNHIMGRYHHPEAKSATPRAAHVKTTPSNAKQDNEEESETVNEPKENTAENKVYTYVEQMPTLPGGGGNAAIVNAIQKTVRYTPLALRNQVEGRIFVSFTVNPQGDISDVKVVKGLGSGLDEETIRAVNTLPKFIPGKQNGQPVAVAFTVPITYKIEAVQNATAKP